MNYEPKMLGLWSVNPEKTARDFFAVAPKIFNSRAKTKKFSRHVFTNADQVDVY